MKTLVVPFILLLIFLPAAGKGQAVNYSKVKIYADQQGLIRLAKAGIPVDHGERKAGVYYVSDFSANELAIIQALGFKTEMLVKDASFYYERRNEERVIGTPSPLNLTCAGGQTFPVPSGFQLGSMGGYPTLAEILSTLDTLTTRYPNLVSAKATINATTTIEGRPIYWVRVSNNPSVRQTKPRILYTALHHAREPASVSEMLYYLFYLCENYATNPEVKFLVDNTEMYFVPCINPDGYVYNQTTNPNGGGLWRKNRRDNLDGTYGVDLNRNYGFNWGVDNVGSSPQTSSDTYRGPAVFSEPETAMMKYLDSVYHFRVTVNYHTYGNDLIYPWGYAYGIYTPDSAEFNEVAGLMTADNHFACGTGNQTVGYLVNGDSDDWAYGDTVTKPKTLALTPEIGSSSDGFWPAANTIIPICQSVLAQNLNAALCITKYAVATDDSDYYLSQLHGFLFYQIKRIGLDSPAVYTVKLIPLSSQLSFGGGPVTYPSLARLEAKMDSIPYTLSGTLTPGTKIRYVLEVSNGVYAHQDTITKVFGTPVNVFVSDGNSMTGWSTTVWGLSTTHYFSPPSSLTDSPAGNYPDNADEVMTTSNPLDLTNALSARLNFKARWEMESGYDYTEVEVSDDNGTTWIPQCGKYTISGSGNQDAGQPLYNGFQLNWIKEDISLDDYLGKNVLLRFELKSDPANNYDGFYVDDVMVRKLALSNGISDPPNKEYISLAQNNPNPVIGLTYISYYLPPGSNGMLEIRNVMGQTIRQFAITAGTGKVEVDGSDLAAGVYLYRIRTAQGSSVTRKLLVSTSPH